MNNTFFIPNCILHRHKTKSSYPFSFSIFLPHSIYLSFLLLLIFSFLPLHSIFHFFFSLSFVLPFLLIPTYLSFLLLFILCVLAPPSFSISPYPPLSISFSLSLSLSLFSLSLSLSLSLCAILQHPCRILLPPRSAGSGKQELSDFPDPLAYERR